MGKNSWDKENTLIVGIIRFLISSILPSVCPTIVHLTAPLSANIVVTISNQSHHFFLSSFNTYIPHHSNPSSSLVLVFFQSFYIFYLCPISSSCLLFESLIIDFLILILPHPLIVLSASVISWHLPKLSKAEGKFESFFQIIDISFSENDCNNTGSIFFVSLIACVRFGTVENVEAFHKAADHILTHGE